jgi:hypothetical protein
MTLYIIRGDTVAAYACVPGGVSADALRFRSARELEASEMSNAQLAAIWNALPGIANSDGSRPGFRDDLAHHSDLISLGIPR